MIELTKVCFALLLSGHISTEFNLVAGKQHFSLAMETAEHVV